MIADTLENLPHYEGCIPQLARVLEYLHKTDLRALALGRHDITGEAAYVLMQEYDTVNEAARLWESHRRHVDIQLVLRGEEYIGYASVASLAPSQPYRPQEDVSLYSAMAPSESVILLGPNAFGVFFPGDGHRPGFHRAKPAHVRKAVFKVLLP